MDRITERINGKLTLKKQFPTIQDTLNIIVSRLELYEDLEEQGLLHIAHIPDWSDIHVLYRAGGDFDEGECIIETKYKYGYTEFLFGEFNKGWFLTKEDAEKELKNQLK